MKIDKKTHMNFNNKNKHLKNINNHNPNHHISNNDKYFTDFKNIDYLDSTLIKLRPTI